MLVMRKRFFARGLCSTCRLPAGSGAATAARG